MVAKNIISGGMYPLVGGAKTAAGAKAVVTAVKQLSNDLTFLSNKYNRVGVYNHTLKENQYILIDSEFDAIMDVEVLASAFNMDKVTFMGHRVLIDGFGNLDNARLAELFSGDSNYTAITSAQSTALNAIPCCVVDDTFFQVYDNLIETGDTPVKEGLYWNNWLHRWATFAISPFANAVALLPSAPTVSTVTVSPATATVNKGASVQLGATVNMTGFGSKEVVWSVPNGAKASVDANGIVTVASDATTSSTITVTAKSVQDGTKTGTATITVGS
jgi:hypothetical protein